MSERFLVLGGQSPIGAWVVRLLLEEGADLLLCDPTPASRVLPLLVEPETLAGLRRIFTTASDSDGLARLLERERITRILDLTRPRSPSGAPDAAGSSGEARLTGARRGLPEITVRVPPLYGVGQEGPFTLAIRAAALSRSYTIPFTGAAALSYARDAALAVIALARSEPAASTAVELAGETVEVSEFIARVEEAVPEAAGLLRASGEETSLPPRLDDGRLLDLLGGIGLPSPTPLLEGIRRTAEMFRELAESGRLPESA